MQYGCSRLKIQTISGSPAENIWIRAGRLQFPGDGTAVSELRSCKLQPSAETERGKLEVFDSSLYQLIARYVKIGGKEYVMELIRRLGP